MCPECKQNVKITSETGICNDCLVKMALATPEGQKLCQDAINMIPPPWLNIVTAYKCSRNQ